MKKTIILTSAIVLTSLAMAAQVAHAETVPSAGSKATFEFTAGDTGTNPPVDPTEPIEPPTGQTGLLAIDAVSDFNFDKAAIKGGETVVNTIVPTDKTVGIQVTDKRGTGAGWNVQAKIGEFKDAADAKKILRGAKVTIPMGTIKTTTTGDAANPPVAIAQGTELNERSQRILTALKDNGKGSWVNDWSDQVKLTIPGGNLVGKYSADITWTMYDTPTGDK